MIWDILEFITLCVNKRGIHPGAHIGLDFLFSAALIFTAVVTFILYTNNDCHGDFCGRSKGRDLRTAGIVGSVFVVIAS